jgi:peptidoglycan/LPS O-acetylase OafA/YrhL
MTLAGRMPEFAVGMAAAFVHRDGRLLAWVRPRAAGLASGSLLIAILGLLALKDTAPPVGQYLVHNAVAAAAAALILMLAVPGHAVARLLAVPPLVYLGRISYGFYLIQVSLVSEPLEALALRCGAWRLPVLLILCVAVCTLLYELVEKPARRAIVARWAEARG